MDDDDVYNFDIDLGSSPKKSKKSSKKLTTKKPSVSAVPKPSANPLDRANTLLAKYSSKNLGKTRPLRSKRSGLSDISSVESVDSNSFELSTSIHAVDSSDEFLDDTSDDPPSPDRGKFSLHLVSIDYS